MHVCARTFRFLVTPLSILYIEQRNHNEYTISNVEEVVNAANGRGHTIESHNKSEGSEAASMSNGFGSGYLGPGLDILVRGITTTPDNGGGVYVDSGGLVDQNSNRDSLQEVFMGKLEEHGQTPMVGDTIRDSAEVCDNVVFTSNETC